MNEIEINVFEDGPLGIKAENIVLKDSAGKPFNLEGKTAIALCRCGASTNKPFCDGSHRGAGFKDKAEATG
jgi:CDGSH-type Zn-finger protein